MANRWSAATCLYCGCQCGQSTRARFVVCSACQFREERDEAREVQAGMQPWLRPQPLLGYFGTPMPDAEARKAQAAWDAEQQRIKDYNAARSGSRP